MDDRDIAEGARARVTFRSAEGRSTAYVFDVFAQDAMPTFDGLPARDWVLRDVYPASSPPLYFTVPARHR